jgi:tetratricopeptide (TPR) repeat protein
MMISNFRQMLTSCFEQGVLFLPVLWQGDKPIGVQGSLIDRKRGALVSLLNGRDLSVKRPPPGFALHVFSLRWAIEHGFRVYDLQTGNFSYKYDFGGLEQRVECLAVATRDGRNLGGALEPRSIAAAFTYCRNAHAGGKFAEAAIGCHQILDSDPDHHGAAHLLEEIGAGLDADIGRGLKLAAGLVEKGRIAEAEMIYRRAVAAEPRHFEAINLLGILLLQREDFKAADEQFARAIDLKPEEAASYYCRGLAQLKLKHLGQALRNFEIAAALKPGDAKAVAIRDKLLGMTLPATRRAHRHQPTTTAG